MLDPTYKTQAQLRLSIPKLPLTSKLIFFWLGFEFRWNRIYHNKKEHYKFLRICVPSWLLSEKAAKLLEIGERFEKVKSKN